MNERERRIFNEIRKLVAVRIKLTYTSAYLKKYFGVRSESVFLKLTDEYRDSTAEQDNVVVVIALIPSHGFPD